MVCFAIRNGLSPRVRGNRQPAAAGCVAGGSIPACAGEPLLIAAAPLVHEVYPRVCGGTLGPGVYAYTIRGLSPRVRGNLGDGTNMPGIRRSIPACAGEPILPSSRRRLPPVYPRVCGGTALIALQRLRQAGLSPRVRGNQYLEMTILGIRRSIPACAGEPRASRIARNGR